MKHFLVLSLFAVAMAAHAEWTPIMQDADFGENHYIDLASISDVDGMIQVTTMSDYPTGKKKRAKVTAVPTSPVHVFLFGMCNV